MFSIVIPGCEKLNDDAHKPPPFTGDVITGIAPVEETSPTPLPASLAEGVIISESLQDGYTVGAISDGTLTGYGLQLRGGDGFIRYSIPTTSHGYVEFSAAGFVPNELHGGEEFKAVIFTMWSENDGYIYESAPFIFELRKFGYIPGRPDASDSLSIRIKSHGIWDVGHYHVLSWDPNRAYRFRVEWGGGYASAQRDGQVVASGTYRAEFSPSNHQVQIGAQPLRRKESPYNLLIFDVVIGTQ